MTDVFFGFILGVISSLLASAIWHEWGYAIARGFRRLLHRLPRPGWHAAPATGMLRIGPNDVPWVVVSYGPYRPETIQVHWDPRPWKLHPVVQRLYEERKRMYERAAARGEPVPFNLESFWVGGQEGPDEDPVLVLRFRPTDYFTMLVTDQFLDEPVQVDGQTTTLRQLFAASVDLAIRPVPELATHFGIALQVITADQRTLFAERGRTAVDAFVFFPSVAEGCSRPVDADPKGGPDPYRTAIREAIEELGIEIPREEIRFLSFGANAVCGVAYVRETSDEVLRRRAVGVPKDKWENQRLHVVPWTPEAVADFVQRHGPWSPFAVVTFYHALLDAFPWERVERAFARTRIRLSQHLPGR